MRRIKKPAFFIVLISILIFTTLTAVGIRSSYGDNTTVYIKGLNDIRWGIDIRGGVDVTFIPSDNIDATDEQMDAVKEVIEQRLISLNITDKELYVDYNSDRVILRFPWKSDEADFNPEEAIKEIGETAMLTFREGYEQDEKTGAPAGITKETIILEGKDVANASPTYNSQNKQYAVSLELTKEGAKKFSDATKELNKVGGHISIWMDDEMFSAPRVSAHITNGQAVIEGNSSDPFTAEEVSSLANKINSGALPFKLETSSTNIISPTHGMGARDAMALSGLIGFILVAIYITFTYKLPGFVASLALIGQIAGSLAAVSGFFGAFPSFTLTIPGIAGIILSIGMGVDANIITAERIKEELGKGKSLEGSLALGYSKAFSAIFDGNITVVLVAMVLMGAFGPPDSMFVKILTPFFTWFGPSAAGAMYSFGYTLIVGVICNFIFGVGGSRLMLASLSKFKKFRNPKLYGGVSND